MLKPKRQRKKAFQQQKEAKKFWMIVGISVAVLLALLFIGFMKA